LRTGDEEQISDRWERTERERTGEWWWCPAPWICDGVLLLQRTGEWLERTESEQGKRDNRERTIDDKQERMNSDTRKPRGMGGFQKLNEGNQRGMRGEFEKPIERGMRNRMIETNWQGWETEWDGSEMGMKPDERRNRMMMGMTGEWNRMRWLISYGRELEIGERKRWGFVIKAAVVCSCGCSRTLHRSWELIILYL